MPKSAPGTRSATLNGNLPCSGNMRRRTSSNATATTITATVARRGGRSIAPPASTSTSRSNASGLASSVRKRSSANSRRWPRWSAAIASSANIAPSANGNAAESTTPGQSKVNVRLEKRADGPHSCQTTSAKASAATPIETTASSLIPIRAASG
jgi:hypothetical protein